MTAKKSEVEKVKKAAAKLAKKAESCGIPRESAENMKAYADNSKKFEVSEEIEKMSERIGYYRAVKDCYQGGGLIVCMIRHYYHMKYVKTHNKMWEAVNKAWPETKNRQCTITANIVTMRGE